jgi:hypothetical protein
MTGAIVDDIQYVPDLLRRCNFRQQENGYRQVTNEIQGSALSKRSVALRTTRAIR